MDNLSFLEEPTELESTAQEVPAEAPEPTNDTPAEQPRGPDGKFASKEAETPPEPKPEPIMVPLAALQETRDKVRDLESKLQQAQPPQQSVQKPDIFADPDGYDQYQEQRLQSALYQERYRSSERFAVMKYGEDSVKEAVNWAVQKATSDPHFNAQAFSSPDPVGFAVEQHQREQIASQVKPDEYQQFMAWKAAQGQPAQAAAPPQQETQPSAPPASIASLPSSGGATHVPTGPGQAFDNLFTR